MVTDADALQEAHAADAAERVALRPFDRIHWLGVAAVVLVAVLLRCQGVQWPRLHPGEFVTAHRLARAATQPYLQDHPLPGGYLTLMRPLRRAAVGAVQLHHRWLFWTGRGDRVGEAAFDDILFARWMNALLGGITCLLVYLLAARVAGGRAGPLLATLLFCLCSGHIERCHYAETDVTAVFLLTFSLWLLARSLTTRSWWPYAMAAVSVGFATGAAYVLAALLPVLVVLPFLRPAPARGRAYWVTVGGAVPVGLMLFVVGFVWANPGVLDLPWFIDGVKAHVAGVVEARAATPDVWRFNLNQWGHYFIGLNLGWLFLVMCGALMGVTDTFRRHGPVLLLTPALLVAATVWIGPPLSRHDTLLLLPLVCLWAAVPVAACTGQAALSWPHVWTVTLAVPVLQALLWTGVNGIGMAGLFGWQDSSEAADAWLSTHAPRNHALAIEHYGRSGETGAAGTVLPDAAYLLRNATLRTRTVAAEPLPPDRAAGFGQAYELLRTWSPIRSRTIAPQFAGHEIQLFGRRSPPDDYRFELALPRPSLISHAGRETYGAVGHWLGSAIGVRVDRFGRRVAVGGPGAAWPVFLVVTTDRLPAVVHIRGMGATHSFAMGPRDARIVPLARSEWLPGLRAYEPVTIRTVPLKGVGEASVLARLAFTRAEAWQLCRQCEKPTVFVGEPPLAGAVPSVLESFEHAVETGAWEQAQRLANKALALWQQIDACLAASRADVRLNGIAGDHYDRFARLRVLAEGPARELDVVPVPVTPGREAAGVRRALLEATHGTVAGVAASSRPLHMPFRLAQGRYLIGFDLRPLLPGSVTEGEPDAEVAFVLGDGTLVARETWPAGDVEVDRPLQIRLPLVIGPELSPDVYVVATRPMRLQYGRMEVRWTWRSVLRSLRERLRASFVTYYRYTGAADAARLLLANRPRDAWNSVALDALENE